MNEIRLYYFDSSSSQGLKIKGMIKKQTTTIPLNHTLISIPLDIGDAVR